MAFAPVYKPPVPAAPAPATTAPPPGRYTLNMDPEVVYALYQEKQGLADLNSSPYPSMPSTASYDQQLANLMQDKAIQLPRLDYALGINKENLQHQNVIQGRNIINSLAGRNMLRSGERGYLKGEQSRAYNMALTDLTTKDTWARQDLDRSVQRAQTAIAAARADANSAYANAMAARAQGIKISQRDLHDHVVQAYINAYQRVISDPALYTGAGNVDPRSFLSQIPTQ